MALAIKEAARWCVRTVGATAALAAILLAPMTAVAGEASVPPPAELQKLLATYAEYESLSPAEKAKTKRPVLAYPPLSKEEAAAWSKALAEAWMERLKSTPPQKAPERLGYPLGWRKAGNITLSWTQADFWEKADEKTTVLMRFAAMTVGEKPAMGWPVFINLHGGGPDPQVNDNGWVVTMGQYPVKQGLKVCPRAPVDSVGSWNDPRSAAALEQLILQLSRQWEIDRNRVYLMGFSMGAIGTFHLGPLMPDRWAAVAGSSGFSYLGTRSRAAADNLRNLPLMIQIGTRDMDFQRFPLAKAFAGAIQDLHRGDPTGYQLEYKEHAGLQHMITDADTPGWLQKFTRQTRPERIVWQQPLLAPPAGKEDTAKILERNYGFAGFFRRRFYWLRNDAPAAFQRLVVGRAGNTFRIEQAFHVDRVTLLLDDRLADLDKPVRVMGGGKELIQTKVSRTVTALVASLVEYGDPELMFCAELDVPAPDSMAELDKSQPTTAAEWRSRAQQRLALKRFTEAAADLEAALKLDPQSAPASLRALLDAYKATKDVARTIDTYKRLAEAAPKDPAVQFEAAMVLMTCEPESLRDDRAALQFAQSAAELTQHRNPQFLRATALAYFRNGQKEKAVATVKAALALIPAGQLPNLRADLEAALKTYSEAGEK
jgi:tetratricopeptide (TPR) repeat protein/predicted esterase